MKSGLITIAAIASLTVLSGAASAGGENCPSKKGAHKDMSAATTKEGVEHGWLKSKKELGAESSAAASADAQKEVPVQPAAGSLKI